MLRIFLPESIGDGAAEYRWTLADAGSAARSGVTAAQDIPAAESCELVVPAARVLLVDLKLPRASGQKLMQMLPFAVEDRIVGEPDTVHVALGARSDDGTATVAVVDREWLRDAVAAIEAAGQKPRRAICETALLPLPDGGWSVLWDDRGGFVRTAAQAGLALDGNDPARAPLALQVSLQEAAAAGAAPQRIVVHQVRGAASPDIRSWAQQLGVPVETGAPWSWETATGAQPEAIDMLQGEFARHNGRAEWIRRLRPAIALAASIAVLHFCALAIDWWLLSRERQQLQAAITAEFRKAFPEAKAVVDAPLQMKRNLADLRRASGAADSSDFVSLLAAATPVLSGAGGRIRALDYERGRLSADLSLPNRERVNALREGSRAPGLSIRVEPGASGPDGVEVRVVFSAARP